MRFTALLRLADLDNSKSAVLDSLTSPASRRVYEFVIEQFIAWYCSEPRLAFNRIVVVRYRIQLEARGLAAATINQRLAAGGAWRMKPQIPLLSPRTRSRHSARQGSQAAWASLG